MLAGLLPLALALALAQQAPPPPPAPPEPPRLTSAALEALLRRSPTLAAPLADARLSRVQVLVGEVVDSGGGPALAQANVGSLARYFYPASTVKLAAAVAAVLELQRFVGDDGGPLDLGTTSWTISPRFAGDDKKPTVALPIARDLRQMLVVSDNDAFNHCYEFVGPATLNRTLWRAGFASARIWHRLSEPHPLDENRRTRAVTLIRGDYRLAIPARDEGDRPDLRGLDNTDRLDLDVGTAHVDGERVVPGPMSFAQKNAIDLRDLQALLAAVVRPEVATGRRGFPELGVGARAFLVESLGMLPRESPDPRYEAERYPDHWAKFVLPGVRRVVPAEFLRVYGKTGRAYGFTIENSYVEDRRSGRGFFLAAVLYTNPDGIVGDDDYGYERLADPWFAALGEEVARVLLAHEGDGR